MGHPKKQTCYEMHRRISKPVQDVIWNSLELPLSPGIKQTTGVTPPSHKENLSFCWSSALLPGDQSQVSSKVKLLFWNYELRNEMQSIYQSQITWPFVIYFEFICWSKGRHMKHVLWKSPISKKIGDSWRKFLTFLYVFSHHF